MAKLIGTAPNQVPINADLGTMAYQDSNQIKVGTIDAKGKVQATDDVRLVTATSTTRRVNSFVADTSYALGSSGGSAIAFHRTSDNSDEISIETHKHGNSHAERFRFGSLGQFGIGGATYGTSGQVLTSGGSGAAPSWVNSGSSTTYGAVGTYVLASRGTSTSSAGSTYAGSGLRPSGYSTANSSSASSGYVVAQGGTTGSTLSGTWRAMGAYTYSVYSYKATLFVRIS